MTEEGICASARTGFCYLRDCSEGAAWGITLAEATRHLADDYAERYGTDPDTTISEICTSYLKSLDAPAGDGGPPRFAMAPRVSPVASPTENTDRTPILGPLSADKIPDYVAAIGEQKSKAGLVFLFQGAPTETKNLKKLFRRALPGGVFGDRKPATDASGEIVCGWAIGSMPPLFVGALLRRVFELCAQHGFHVEQLHLLEEMSDGTRRVRVIAGPGAEAMSDGREGEEVIQDVALGSDSQAPQVTPAVGAEGGAES
jgi:hypothetical protein